MSGRVTRQMINASNAADRFVLEEDGRFVVYDLSADTRGTEDLVGMTRLLSGREINSLGNVMAISPQLKWVRPAITRRLHRKATETIADE